ncbi:hypothetical protein IRJ14_19385, partial [Isoptericola sp. QY 916]|nr:hypothetical protein [Isoptericola sp. QY 916]
REVTEDKSWEDDADAVESWQLVYADGRDVVRETWGVELVPPSGGGAGPGRA